MYTAMLTVENLHGAEHDVWAVNTDFDYHEEQRVEQPSAKVSAPAVGKGRVSVETAGEETTPGPEWPPRGEQPAERRTALRQPNTGASERMSAVLLAAQAAQRHPATCGERRVSCDMLAPLLTELERLGLEFAAHRHGPWWVGCDDRTLPGRKGDLVIPTITRGRFRLKVSDFRLATRLAGFLSWCDVPEPPTAQESLLQRVHG